ncbi:MULTISPECIES: antibiotic biosynthesis monooxygenase [Paraburkholderia]|uniref:antibiotic biosynthesis monooxygenase family protein n=1 Tax=Paraburkholderia TaxID=1822464 RepID=UPI002258D3FD|nr:MULTISPECIES: antibiotic biosynthesis monooxygenase [Paraburkholderia]MCX4164958.1 antibiotic biosynthesis monooxygenase [Paraburkholderia megapolitana]MDN7160451.1 antibiotic biosynthesis monooxygenase [Paraburkholderia sp. CHISQ3]MDQ6497498.1 antibiotic biosynthesis monooxygenase [Paraburkholderia megapolitana]
MIVTVLRSRLNPDAQEDYKRWLARMSVVASEVPGYISHRDFIAEDGERVIVVEFESEEDVRAWTRHREYAQANKKGGSALFAEFRVQVCNVVRDTADHWSRTMTARTML